MGLSYRMKSKNDEINIIFDNDLTRNEEDCCIAVRRTIYLLVYHEERLTGWLETLPSDVGAVIVSQDQEFPPNKLMQFRKFKEKLHLFKWTRQPESKGSEIL